VQPKKRALGRGLEALLPQKPKVTADKTAAVKKAEAEISDESSYRMTLPITAIRRNEAQPREYFDEEALHQLADSIKRHGIIQPLAVMPRENDYVIVAGERRWRAAQLAGMRELPVIVLKHLDEGELLEYALVENLQRENLNPIEEAKAYRSLQTTFNLTAEEIAEHVGKSRSSIANALRLLAMPAHMQEDLESERISTGHAKVLMGIENKRDQVALRDLIVSEHMSVRQAEIKARDMMELAGVQRKGKAKSASGSARAAKAAEQPDHVKRLREQLVEALACKVTVNSPDGTRGKIEIHFESLDELQFVLNQLGVEV